MGKKIHSEKLKSNAAITINTSRFPNGMYSVVLSEQGQFLETKKLIIAH
jgi:hypothetical protein